MAGSDPQKQLLALIRDYITAKTQAERRKLSLKKRIEEQKSELDALTAKLKEAKRDKETAEQELKGYEVESSMNKASLQAVEARAAVICSDGSTVRAESDAIESEVDLREGLIEKVIEVIELNPEIRKSLETAASSSNADIRARATLPDGSITTHEQDGEQAGLLLANELAQMISHIKAEKEFWVQIQEDYDIMKKKISLLMSVMEEGMELREFSRPTSELEEKRATFGDEQQKGFLCPGCNLDNSEELGDNIQPKDRDANI